MDLLALIPLQPLVITTASATNQRQCLSGAGEFEEVFMRMRMRCQREGDHGLRAPAKAGNGSETSSCSGATVSIHRSGAAWSYYLLCSTAVPGNSSFILSGPNIGSADKLRCSPRPIIYPPELIAPFFFGSSFCRLTSRNWSDPGRRRCGESRRSAPGAGSLLRPRRARPGSPRDGTPDQIFSSFS